MAPIVNNVRAMRRIGRRPKTCEKAMNVGCQTVVARRKAVPIHNACIAVPWSASEIVCLLVSEEAEGRSWRGRNYWKCYRN